MIHESGYRTVSGDYLVKPNISLNEIYKNNKKQPSLGFISNNLLLQSFDSYLV